MESIPTHEKNAIDSPSQGRQLLSFTDSRQGTARFAARIEKLSARNYIRSFIYHAVQRTPAPLPGEDDLQQEYDALVNLVPVPGWAQRRLQEIAAQLKDAAAPRAVPWEQMRQALAAEPTLYRDIAKVWQERDKQLDSSKEALANFMLFDELARRPKYANSSETLGLVQLRFPPINRLTASAVPHALRDRGLGLEDWQEFLYALIDMPVRSSYSIEAPENYLRWLPVRLAYLPALAAPGNRTEDRQRPWPRPGSRSIPVLALEDKIGLDSRRGEGRAIVAEALSTAWEQLLPLFEGIGTRYRLYLDRSVIAAVRDAWFCPVTAKVLPRLLFGRSPYGYQSKHPESARPPEKLTMPRLRRGQAGDADAVARWAAEDCEVQALRAIGAWTNLHERAAGLPSYIRAEEHSAQQPPSRLRQFERDFAKGAINLLACSTTMEMGVDIGSVSEVLNTNVPPSIANYRQRVGRGGQVFAASLTFTRDTSLDRETFYDPAGYLQRKIRAPRVLLESQRIVQRHANAALLAAWFRQQSDSSLMHVTTGVFHGRADAVAPADRFLAWLKAPATGKEMAPTERRAREHSGKYSMFLYDTSSGGTGYALRLTDDIDQLLRAAQSVLDCPAQCETACSACAMAGDLYLDASRFDRLAASAAVEYPTRP